MLASANIIYSLYAMLLTFFICFVTYHIIKKHFFHKKEEKIKDIKKEDFKEIQDMKQIFKNNVDAETDKAKKEIIGQEKNKEENKLILLEKKVTEMTQKLNDVEGMKAKMNKMETENKEMKAKVNKVEEKMKITDLNLMIQNKEINILKIKNNIFLNSFKILYFRKIANILLNEIFINYKEQFYETPKIFIDKQKPAYLAKPFSIIIAKNPINKFKMNNINLLIDYLMFVKDFTSSFIHIEKKNTVQTEILFSIFQEKNIIKDEKSNEYLIDSSILINTVLGEQEKEIQEEQKDGKESFSEGINEISNKEKTDNVINIPIKNIYKNEPNNGNGHSSDNGISTNIDDNGNNGKENQGDDISEKNEKDELMKKIDDIISRMNANYKNNDYSMEKELNQINELNVENLLEKKQGFSENELLKLENIKSLKDLIIKYKNSSKGSKNIDVGFIYNEWKKSFNQSYKKSDKFKYLVDYDKKINLLDIKKVANGLLIKNETKTLKLFGKEQGNFKDFDILDESKFKWYSENLAKN
jgi:hypothetical protein